VQSGLLVIQFFEVLPRIRASGNRAPISQRREHEIRPVAIQWQRGGDQLASRAARLAAKSRSAEGHGCGGFAMLAAVYLGLLLPPETPVQPACTGTPWFASVASRCRDQDRSTIGRADFESLTTGFDVGCRIEEVD